MDGDAVHATVRSQPDAPPTAEAALEAWRAQGADRIDPLRFDLIAAMAARVHDHAGTARALLEQRLSRLVQAYADTIASASPGDAVAKQGAIASSALAALSASLARPVVADPASADLQAAPAPLYPELPVLDELRTVWSRLRNDSQMRESMEQVPADAGPLNSGMLVHRALQLMQATAPGYLQHFIAYADTLSSLQQLRESTVPAGADARAPTRGRGRKRSG
ncbi:DUF2894 domain-containing protein [Pseudoxanthomonas daejeonensis]|uniref:DUF2894 domain-containing protein n=1 Tax=Pseudoxanthomonas daejeonensis TaxID=266062 RepID=A0ABQ6Z3H0_9GAMM|nr:DUF2894 domain-containing protein [Pseudoxanthomonas daejeonensis]KAF1692074.1 hypothetical protein CSC65_15145 [Pseudoxanthomonas daejeonensis]UNK58340.1 DUF2894 domain-containing protein [Pseudoxanthomonas daejeonensis]